MIDARGTYLHTSSTVSALARTTGDTAEARDTLKRSRRIQTGTGDGRCVPLSNDTYSRAGPEASALLNHRVYGQRQISFQEDVHGRRNAKCPPPFAEGSLGQS